MTLTYSWNGTGYTVTNSSFVGANEAIPSSYDDGVHGVANVNRIGQYAFFNQTNLQTISIPNTIIQIDNYAFAGCSSLNSLTIPPSTTTIGQYTFSSCGILTVSIPNTVTSIGIAAFSSCPNLDNVTIGTGFNRISDFLFFNCSSLKNITIPSTITQIGQYAFSSAGINYITLPNSITLIDERAFSGCALINITIPDSVTTIAAYAFYATPTLLEITIGNGTTTIGSTAFGNCFNLKKCIIGKNLNNLGSDTFSNCFALQSIIFLGNKPATVGSNIFLFTPSTMRVFRYSTKSGWSSSFGGRAVYLLNQKFTQGLLLTKGFSISPGTINIKKNILGAGNLELDGFPGVSLRNPYIYIRDAVAYTLEMYSLTPDSWIDVDEGWHKLEQVTDIYNPGSITIYYWRLYFDDGVTSYTISTNPSDLNPNTNPSILQKRNYVPYYGWQPNIVVSNA